MLKEIKQKLNLQWLGSFEIFADITKKMRKKIYG
jgi:hypothetical protein